MWKKLNKNPSQALHLKLLVWNVPKRTQIVYSYHPFATLTPHPHTVCQAVSVQWCVPACALYVYINTHIYEKRLWWLKPEKGIFVPPHSSVGRDCWEMVQKVLYDTQVQELKLVNCHLCSSRMNYSICCVDWKSNFKSLACLKRPMQNIH